MTIIRRVVAAGGLVLAVLGLLTCLAGALGTWAVKARAQAASAAVFGAADGAFDFIATRVARARARVEATRPRVSRLSDWARRLQSIEFDRDVQAAMQALRESLDEAAAELKAADGALDPVEAVARGVEKAATALERTSVRSADVAEFAGEVATAARRLEALRVKLLDIRERRLLAREFAAMCLVEAADLDTRLANLVARIDAFAARVSAARASSAETGRRVHAWIALGALLLVAMLVWFAASQVCVMRRLRAAWRPAVS